jgi:hypothetical protein
MHYLAADEKNEKFLSLYLRALKTRQKITE